MDVPMTRRTAARDGVYYAPTIRTSNVGALYKKVSVPVDEKIEAQPLVIGSAATPKGNRSVVYVATHAGTVYAFDAQDPSSLVWDKPLRLVNHANRVIFTDDFALGILGTPAIDVESNAMYVVAQSCRHPICNPDPDCELERPPHCCEQSSGCPTIYQTTNSQMKNCRDSVHTLFKIDIRDGRITNQVEIAAPARDKKGPAFNSSLQLQRPGLLVANKKVYVAFGPQECDYGNSHGWLLAYDAASLRFCSAFNTTPGGRLGGIWQSGAGVAADTAGNVYVETGNGPKGTNYGESILKFPASGGGCSAASLAEPVPFTPGNETFLNKWDLDIGSSGPVVLPGGRLIAGSKQGKVYVLDTNTMTGKSPQATCNLYCSTFSQIEQDQNQSCHDDIARDYPHIHGSPVWWDERSQIFVWGELDYLRRLTLTPAWGLQPSPVVPVAAGGGCTTTGTSRSSSLSAPLQTNGGMLSLSLGDDGSAILWAQIPSTNLNYSRLLAFDAARPDLKLLWSSDSIKADWPTSKTKFLPPTIAYGHVYVATYSPIGTLDVYGIGHTGPGGLFEITRTALDQTRWGFGDTNTVHWARAARAASGFCLGKGFAGGSSTGTKPSVTKGPMSQD
jgi:hypothetical protein